MFDLHGELDKHISNSPMYTGTEPWHKHFPGLSIKTLILIICIAVIYFLIRSMKANSRLSDIGNAGLLLIFVSSLVSIFGSSFSYSHNIDLVSGTTCGIGTIFFIIEIFRNQ